MKPKNYLTNTHQKHNPAYPTRGTKQGCKRKRCVNIVKQHNKLKTSENSSFWGTTNEHDRQHGDIFTDRQLTATYKQQVRRPFLAIRNCYSNKKQLAGNRSITIQQTKWQSRGSNRSESTTRKTRLKDRPRRQQQNHRLREPKPDQRSSF
jgi:hypothetical protein